MKILLFGKNGQVGWELQRSLAPLGELIALDSKNEQYCGDLTDLAGIARSIRDIAPDIIVNAAAYTAVDKAESDVELARTVNALAPGVMAKAASESNATLVHFSTDYVFDGSGNRPWQENDTTGPLSVYGKTKLDGELLIQQAGCKHLIFRTSWVYAARGGNFAKTMLRLAGERDQLSVINDQFGSPTGAEMLADVTAHCIRQLANQPQLSGLYHLVASGETTWYDYACYVIESARRSGVNIKVAADAIKAIPSSAYPVPAQRPKNSRLNTQKLQDTFQLQLPDWRYGITRMLTEISGDK